MSNSNKTFNFGLGSTFGQENIFNQGKFCGHENFRLKKVSRSKKFWYEKLLSLKNIRPRKIFGSEKNQSPDIFAPKGLTGREGQD